MENSKCSKGNSRSLWLGPAILVRVLPLFFLEYPRATCHDFHPRRYILPGAIVTTISRLVVRYILYRFHAIAGGFNRLCHLHLIAISSVSLLSRFLHSQIQISVNHFISCSCNIKWCMSESTLIVYCNFILHKNTDTYEFINCA